MSECLIVDNNSRNDSNYSTDWDSSKSDLKRGRMLVLYSFPLIPSIIILIKYKQFSVFIKTFVSKKRKQSGAYSTVQEGGLVSQEVIIWF